MKIITLVQLNPCAIGPDPSDVAARSELIYLLEDVLRSGVLVVPSGKVVHDALRDCPPAFGERGKWLLKKLSDDQRCVVKPADQSVCNLRSSDACWPSRGLPVVASSECPGLDPPTQACGLSRYGSHSLHTHLLDAPYGYFDEGTPPEEVLNRFWWPLVQEARWLTLVDRLVCGHAGFDGTLKSHFRRGLQGLFHAFAQWRPGLPILVATAVPGPPDALRQAVAQPATEAIVQLATDCGLTACGAICLAAEHLRHDRYAATDQFTANLGRGLDWLKDKSHTRDVDISLLSSVARQKYRALRDGWKQPVAWTGYASYEAFLKHAAQTSGAGKRPPAC